MGYPNTHANGLTVSMGFAWVILDASVSSDPLNPLRIGKENANGFGITPCNLSESICRYFGFLSVTIPLLDPR